MLKRIFSVPLAVTLACAIILAVAPRLATAQSQPGTPVKVCGAGNPVYCLVVNSDGSINVSGSGTSTANQGTKNAGGTASWPVALFDSSGNGLTSTLEGGTHQSLDVNIAGGTNPNGQSTMANSAPVAIASDQTPIGGVGSDGSTTITTGGTAQNLFSAATPADGFEICNPDVSEDLWISWSTTAAANATGSTRVPPNGGCYDSPTAMKPFHAVSVIAATTAHKITATKW